MKNLTICFLLLITANATFSQESNPSPVVTKQDYLKKSKNQKIAAVSILGGGIVLITSGVISMENTRSKGGQESILILSGLVISSISIPFFICSHINKMKAMSVAFKNQVTPVVSDGSFDIKFIPSLNIKMNL